MKKSLIYLLLTASALIVGLTVTSCKEAEETYNCATICEAWKDCAEELNVDVNLADCTNECEEQSSQSEDFANSADECQDCLDTTGSCSDNYDCVDDCSDVVPDLSL